MVQLSDGLSGVIRVLILKESEVVKSIFIFLDIEFDNLAHRLEQFPQFFLNNLFRLLTLNIGDENFATIIDFPAW